MREVGLALIVFGLGMLTAGALFVALRGLDRRAVRHVASDFRYRAAATREAMAVRSRGQLEVFRARRELAELEADRNRLYRDLGRAVYEGDETGTRAARNALDGVVERIRGKEAEIDSLIRSTEERVQHVQAHTRPTERMEAPEPARVPEPWPPPDEGDLPTPPTPAPGEPTPGPEEPAPPQHPPMPQTDFRG